MPDDLGTIPYRSPPPPKAKNKGIPQLIFCVITLTSIGLSIGWEINRQSTGRGPASLTQAYAQWDGYLASAAPRDGVFLKFVGFYGDYCGFISNIYYRAVFVLYPKPVIVADPSVMIRNEHQIMGANTYASDQWLSDHDVGCVFTIGLDVPGVRPVPVSWQWLSGKPKEH